MELRNKTDIGFIKKHLLLLVNYHLEVVYYLYLKDYTIMNTKSKRSKLSFLSLLKLFPI